MTVTVSDFQAAGDALPSPLGNLTFKADLEMERDPGALLKRKKTSGHDLSRDLKEMSMEVGWGSPSTQPQIGKWLACAGIERNKALV